MNPLNNVSYRLIKTKEYVEDSGLVTAFGVCCREDLFSQNRHQVKYQVVPNISTDHGLVEGMVDDLNRCGANPCHLKDVIYDYIP